MIDFEDFLKQILLFFILLSFSFGVVFNTGNIVKNLNKKKLQKPGNSNMKEVYPERYTYC